MAQQSGHKPVLNERRGARRYATFFPVRLLPGEGFRRLCVCQDMSVSGGLMVTQSPLSVGQRVELALFNPAGEEPPRRSGARIVRVAKRSTNNRLWKYEAAVKFDEHLADIEPALATLSEEQRRAGLR